jgi:hypothetical protein
MDAIEAKYYRDLYRIVSNPDIEQLFVKYAQMQYNKALAKLRTKQADYEQGYSNGNLDAWQEVINLKANITKIMQNVS